MSSTDRRSAEEIIAAEAVIAREKAVYAKDPVAWLSGYFNAVAKEFPHVRGIRNRERFIELATASTQGES